MTRRDLMFVALGQVVGSGVVTLIGVAQLLSGASAWLAYAVAVFVGFFLAFPFFIIGSTLRLGGGPYSAVYALLGARVSGVYLMGQIPAVIGIAVYPIAVGTYVKSLWPNANTMIVALCVLIFFFVVNLLGINIFAKVQNFMGYVLIASMLLFVAVGIFKVDWQLLSMRQENFFAGGTDGFLAAIFLFCYSTHGYYFAVGFGKDAKRARRDIPPAMAICIPLIFVMYTGCAIVATGVLPISEVAGQPLTLVARTVMPTVLFWVFILGGVTMALTTSLNASFGYQGRVIGTGVTDGWLPSRLARVNKRGTQTWILIIIFCMNLIPILTGFDVGKITNNVILFTSILLVIMYIGAFRIPKMYPEQWATSVMHMPTPLFYVIMTVSTIAQGFMIYYSCRGVGAVTAVISIGALVVAALYSVIRWKTGGVNAQPSVWSD